MGDRHLLAFLHLLIVLNLLDAVFTVGWVKYCFLPELNPIMAYTLSINLSLFLAVKALMVPCSAWILWRCRSHRLAAGATLIFISIYTAVLVWHIFGLTLYLLGD